MRKLATIQQIDNIEVHPNADSLEIATVKGWHCVTQKGQHKIGDLIIYFEVDSFLPVREEFEFLRKGCYKKLQSGEEGFRIKTIKLRGFISQGLILPLSLLKPQAHVHMNMGANKCASCNQFKELKAGDDVTEALGVMLYQPPIPACIAGEVKGSFPSFLPKTDETRVQVLQPVLTRHKGIMCYITEKLDGSSSTYSLKDGIFSVCSRNLELRETADNAFWQYAREAKVEEKMRDYSEHNGNVNFAIQGELCGNGIQSNYLNIEGRKVFFFNAFNIDSYKYYSASEMVNILGYMGLEMVPILRSDYVLDDNIDTLIALSEGNSLINPKKKREGIVIRPVVEMIDMQMSNEFNNGRLSFKAINPKYLLEEE